MSAGDIPLDRVRWDPVSAGDGIVTYQLESWSEFFEFIETSVFSAATTSRHQYIWRGQRRDDWGLSSSIDRLFADLGLLTNTPADLERRVNEHLESFRYAARGRRGRNPAELDENEWWSLGQHYGLSTPLLDWTRSPFAAAYFAFEIIALDPTPYRVVFGLDQQAVSLRSAELSQGPSVERGRPPVLEFIDPMSNDNERLVSQGGLFTRAPVGVPVERWVAANFEGSSSAVLLRIRIPDRDRLLCLRTLNRMNINHLSLFPDLAGASRFVNLRMELDQ